MIIFFFILLSICKGAKSGTCGDECKWSYNSTSKVLAITGKGKMTDYDVIHYDYPPWYEYRKTLTKITIQNGITTIGNFAFYGCYNIKSLNIPNSITQLRKYSLAFCTELVKLTIPKSVVAIGGYAFRGCTSLATIKYEGIQRPSNCKETTLYDCRSLKNVTVPSQYYVNSTTFCDFKKLVSANEDQTGTCGSNCTWNYNSTSKVLELSGTKKISNYAKNVTPFHLIRNYYTKIIVHTGLTFVGTYVFHDSGKVKSLSLPPTLTEIRSYAFSHLKSLNKLRIPKNVELIHNNAFDNETNLEYIYYEGYHQPRCNKTAFSNCDKVVNVTIPSQYYSEATDFCGFKKIGTEIEDQTGTCGNNCTWKFNLTTNYLEISGENEMKDFVEKRSPWYLLREHINEINVDKSISTIGTYAFSDIKNVRTVSIAETVESIDDTAFDRCSDLEEVIFYGTNEPLCSNMSFIDSELLLNVSVPFEYEDEEFCGKEIINREEEIDPNDNTAMIVGIVCGVIGGLLLIIIIVGVIIAVFLIKKKSGKSSYQDLDGLDENEDGNDE